MREYRVIISPEAGADIRNVHDYIERSSPQNATQVARKLVSAIEGLLFAPHRTIVDGRQIRGNPVRRLTVRPYNIFFYIHELDGVVRVLRVFHGAMQLPDALE